MAEKLTRSGVPLKPFYVQGDVPAAADPAPPGEFPFTRGRLGSGRKPAAWIQRELSGEGDPAHSNAQLHYLIGKGQTGVDVIGDSPTQAQMDPDHPLAAHSVGTQGVSVCCKDDYLELFRGIPLDAISISSSVPALFSMTGLYLAARSAGVAPERVRGSALQVPLYSEDCGYPTQLPCELRARLSADVMEFCAAAMPRFHAYVEDTYFFSESGLTGVEEMALGFVEIRFLVRELLRRGVPVDRFAPRIAILVNCSMDFYEEVAKLRATRRIYARMMKEEFGAQDPRSMSVNLTSHTSGLSLTAEQPANNIVRGTVQALALAMGGAQAIEISAFDEAYRTPSRESHLVGLRTQQILELEAGVSQVADPFGGSYFMEALTAELEQRIEAMVREIESAGDAIQLADSGWFKAFFHRAMERHARGVREGQVQVVGHNVHRVPDEEDLLLRDVSERKIEPWRARVERIRAFKAGRGRERLHAALGAVLDAARGRTANLVPPVLAAVEADATMGEITGTLRMGYGFPYDPHRMTVHPTLEAGP
jgi:methylmalonyl-CoA mutase N-terminal domain/subunit